MFDIGWSEMAIIAVVALVVIGPKELPNALRTVTQFLRYARKMASEFQGGIDQIVREAELDEARRTIQSVTSMDIKGEVAKVVDPTGELQRTMSERIEDAASSPAATISAVPGAATEPSGDAAAAPPAPFAAQAETVMPTATASISDETMAEPVPSRPAAVLPPEPVAIAPESVMAGGGPAIDDMPSGQKAG
ncbi:MAG: Sec-independent protein translocase protein TatB [Dongiaceae bacterium]